MASDPLYFLGLNVTGTSDPKLHMTICLVPEPKAESSRFTDELEALSKAVLPVTLILGNNALFGKDATIPVRMVTIADAAKRDLIEAFMLTHHRPPASDVHRGAKQVFHLSVKDLSPMEAETLTEVKGTSLSLGLVGGKGKTIWKSSGQENV
jgi:hypothetical protein